MSIIVLIQGFFKILFQSIIGTYVIRYFFSSAFYIYSLNRIDVEFIITFATKWLVL